MNEIATSTTQAMDASARLAVIEYRIHEHMTNAAGHLLGVGQCLNEAKASGLVAHGDWEDWVRRNTGFSVRQAQRMMNAARQVPEGSTLAQLPFSKIQACLQLPSAEDREAMAKRAQDEDMSLRELQAAVDRERARADALAGEKKAQEEDIMQLRARLKDEREKAKALRGQVRVSQEDADIEARRTNNAEAEVARLRAELADMEAQLERQADLRQQAQQELLNFKAQAQATGGAQENTAGMTPQQLRREINTFLGHVSLVPHMRAELSGMDRTDRSWIRDSLDLVTRWADEVRQAMDAVIIDG